MTNNVWSFSLDCAAGAKADLSQSIAIVSARRMPTIILVLFAKFFRTIFLFFSFKFFFSYN